MFTAQSNFLKQKFKEFLQDKQQIIQRDYEKDVFHCEFQ